MRALRSVLLLCLAAASADAQATLGSAAVGGTVRDPTGAAVPEARIALTETARGLVRETVSNSAGSYLFPSVSAGVYSLRVSKEAFEAYELKDVHLDIGQLATLDVSLKVGQISTVVSVSAEKLVLLETESNGIGTVVDSARVESLPLNGRNFLQLALIAGSNEPTGRSDVINTQVGHPSRGVIITGNMATTTGYSINGIATRGGRLGESSLNLSIADIDQFKVQQNFFMPDQGPNPGLVNVTTKGGTNQFHGQAFEFVRNEVFDARNFFSPAPENLKRNQFGAAGGGPIRKDKMWFYANYEGLREITGFSARAFAPTAAMFGGDLREVTQTIYDPATFSAETGLRQPFANKIIPANRINPISKSLLRYYTPGSSLSQLPSNVFANPRNTLDDDQYGFRIDASLTDRQNLFGQFIRQNSPVVKPGVFPLSGAFYPNSNTFMMLQHTYTPRPNLVNTARVGGTRNLALFANEGSTHGNILNELGIPNTKDGRGVIGVGITGFSGFGRSNGDLGNIDNNYQLDDGVNYIRGTHNYQFGVGIRYRRTWQQNANAGANGNLAYQPTFSAQLAPNAQRQLVPQAGTGNAFADYLLGMPTSAGVNGLAMFPYRFTQYIPYVQDTWKVTRNLTLNYGISWFLATVPNPQGSARQLPHGFDTQSGLIQYAALGEVDPRILSEDRNNFTPRFGFAWKPEFLPNTVIRSGIGMYYGDSALIEMQFAMVSPPFNSPVTLINSQTDPLPTYELGRNIFPVSTFPPLDKTFAASLPNGSSAFLLEPNGRTPYVTQWNFSVQHSFSDKDLLEVVYLGSSGHKLQNRYDFDQCRVGADLRCDPATRPWQRYTGLLMADFNGNSSYESVVTKFRRRAGGGLNLNLEYTFAKALMDGWESGGSTDSQITVCRRCDKGPASFDQRHRLTASIVYDLPFGRGRRFGKAMPRAADLVAGGWSLTGLAVFATGVPIFLTGPNRTGSPNVSHRPNRVCDGRDDSLSSNLRGNGFVHFDTSCFVIPPTGFFGNAGRSVLNGPGGANWDIGLGKTFPLPFNEQTRLEFRGEFFNAFNHTQFGLPNADSGAGPNFGRVSSAHTPRLIQLGAKVIF
jgi:hypothetical protein